MAFETAQELIERTSADGGFKLMLRFSSTETPLTPIRIGRSAVREVLVIATWQSEHLVELEDENGVENLVQVLQAQSNVKLVGYTARPLAEAVDLAIDELLDC